jgi:hypothetical protein
MHVSRIFCDLAEAFHCVNHDMLLSKLNLYGIQCKAILSFLNGRKQRVEIKFPNSNDNTY